MSLLPPVSGRKAVRLQNAAMVNELSDLYSYLMSIWISEGSEESHIGSEKEEDETPVGGDSGTKGGKLPFSGPSVVKPKWVLPLKKRMLKLMEQMQTMQMQTAMAKFEGGIRGAWPAEEYQKLLEKESDMLAALGQASEPNSV